mmetsp:Transcript_26261/g.66016  ORF Transcript_26261/g.66016 Transcript_26261/m.66016 type:complete len:240 (+) Transcript_26261:249-968(+)
MSEGCICRTDSVMEFLPPQGFSLRTLTDADVDVVARGVSEAFCSREPLTLGHIHPDQFLQFSHPVVKASAASGLSVVLTTSNPSTGQENIVAAMVSEDLAVSEAHVSSCDDLHEHFTTIFALLKSLSMAALKPHRDTVSGKLREGEIFHCFLGYTQEGFEGLGLGKVIRQAAIRRASSLGFKILLVEATNPVTRHIWKKSFSANEHTVLRPCDFHINGDRPWRELEVGQEIASLTITLC